MVKITQNHSIHIFLVLPLLAVMLIHGSSSQPNAYAADQSPEDICPLGVPGGCVCQSNSDGTGSCCTTDSGGNKICSKCDYDSSTGTYSNCQSVPGRAGSSQNTHIPIKGGVLDSGSKTSKQPDTNIPNQGGVFQNMPSNPGTSSGNSNSNTNGGVLEQPQTGESTANKKGSNNDNSQTPPECPKKGPIPPDCTRKIKF